MIFTVSWFSIIVMFHWLPSEKYKIVSWKKKGLEDLIDLFVSFSIVFVIDVIMYYLGLIYLVFPKKRGKGNSSNIFFCFFNSSSIDMH